MHRRYTREYERYVAAIANCVRPVTVIVSILLTAEIILRYQHGASAHWQWTMWLAVVIAGICRELTASIILVTGVCILYVCMICVMWVASVIEYCAMAVGWRRT